LIKPNQSIPDQKQDKLNTKSSDPDQLLKDCDKLFLTTDSSDTINHQLVYKVKVLYRVKSDFKEANALLIDLVKVHPKRIVVLTENINFLRCAAKAKQALEGRTSTDVEEARHLVKLLKSV